MSAFFDQDVEKMIKVSRAQRSKKKHVTIIVGLKTFGTNSSPTPPSQFHVVTPHTDIDLKKASKSFAQHFSCGSSVTGDDEIVIQGDVTDDIIDFIQEKWPEVCITFACHTSHYLLFVMQVEDDLIDYIGDQKR